MRLGIVICACGYPLSFEQGSLPETVVWAFPGQDEVSYMRSGKLPRSSQGMCCAKEAADAKIKSWPRQAAFLHMQEQAVEPCLD